MVFWARKSLGMPITFLFFLPSDIDDRLLGTDTLPVPGSFPGQFASSLFIVTVLHSPTNGIINRAPEGWKLSLHLLCLGGTEVQ